MSDPNTTGPYECCEPMRSLQIVGIYDGTCAYLCPQCGVWRHRFSPGDPRRAQVEAAMPKMIEAQFQPRGEVR